MRDGQICPTVNEAMTLEEAIDAAIILARYDDAEYVVAQSVFRVVPNGDSVEVRRATTGRIVQRETFGPWEGRKGEAEHVGRGRARRARVE